MQDTSRARTERCLGLWVVLALLVIEGLLILTMELDVHSKVSATIAIGGSLAGAFLLNQRRSYAHAKLWVTFVMFVLLQLWCLQAPMAPLLVTSGVLVLLAGQGGALLLFLRRARPLPDLARRMLSALVYWLPPFYSTVLMVGAYVRYMRRN